MSNSPPSLEPSVMSLPTLSGSPRKNDGLFIYGATQPHPYVHAYCQDSTEIILGPSCKEETEVNSTLCALDNVPISYRRSGGGTVVLSPGMVVIVVVDKRDPHDTIEEMHARIHRGLIIILDLDKSLGLSLKGISDIAIGQKKILGSSLYLSQKPMLYYYQSVLMVNSNTSLISKYLKHPPKEPDYRKGRSHDEFCTTLKQEGCTLTVTQVAEKINANLGNIIQKKHI
jgi:lipoate-protein ligase A